MDATDNDALVRFANSIANNLQKNGFPQRKVAFSIEKMYESAARKDLSFNKVLELLAEQGINHEKTPEKIIFTSAVQAAPAASSGAPEAAAGPLGGMDLGALENMSPDQMMAAASRAAQQMSPEQLQAIQNMVGNMSPEQMQAMMEQAKKLGLG